MEITSKISKHNFRSFLWHATFLAFASNFMDVDTIIPSMITDAGGGAFHVGLMSTIMLGGSSFSQLFFAPFISNKHFKKKYLLLGISGRILALFGLSILLFSQTHANTNFLWLIFLFITLFAVGGAFANVSFTDILGKSILPDKRKTFFSSRQVLSGIVVLVSAFLAKRMLSHTHYPLNYAYMFLIGASLLTIASLGFWSVKEGESSHLGIKSWKHFSQQMKLEFKSNYRLKYFMGFINTQGIAISFLPFIILYGKETFGNETIQTGNLLLFKIIGVVLVSILVLLGVKKLKYTKLLYINASLSLLLGFLALFFLTPALIKYMFLIGGVVFSLYNITMNGLLLEISGKENRTLYTGFSGAGNIIPALFPLLGASIIQQFGFQYFFGLYILIVAIALFFINKINCKA